MSHTLVLLADGGVELHDHSGNVIWSSDDDESFHDEFPDDVLDENDVEDILEYLVSDDVIADVQADHCEIECECDDDDDDDDDDDEDEDDDDDDDDDDSDENVVSEQ